MELKHLNLVDETNVQMAMCPKDTSFYIIITSDGYFNGYKRT